MTDKKINELVKEYNKVEAEQDERLIQLFKALKERTGYRKVTFSSGQLWSNCWSWDERMSQKLVLNDFSRKIKKVDM